MRRHLITITAAALAALATTVAVAAPASASERDYQVDGANIRAAADPYAAVIGLGYIGQGLSTICYRDGHDVNGAYEYFIYHRNHTTGVTGYTVGANVAGVINDLQPC